ncbi:MAG: hypothetical protein WBM41_18740 [Arenicellales bacterium]
MLDQLLTVWFDRSDSVKKNTEMVMNFRRRREGGADRREVMWILALHPHR